MKTLKITTTEADKHWIEIERCKSPETLVNGFAVGLPYYISQYVKIENKVKSEDSGAEIGNVIPFDLWDCQKEVLGDFLKEQLIQVLKANQIGLTWLVLAYASYLLIFKVGCLVLGISETELKAKRILIDRILFIFRYLPNWMVTDAKHKKAGVPWYEPTELTITVHHPLKDGKHQEDSFMQAFPSSPTAGASFTADLVIIDEWALQQYAHEIWTYLFPTINRVGGGQVIGISTIELGTLFTEIWENPKSGFKKIFLSWKSDPRRDAAWYQKTLEIYGIDETRKHYPATAEEAFSVAGGKFFSEFSSDIHLKKPLLDIPEYFIRYRSMDYGTDCFACYWYYIDTYGYARIYKEIHKEGLVISQAAYELHKASGAQVPETVEEWDALETEDKQKIAETTLDAYNATYAPIDLFHKSNHTGKAGSDVWWENGVTLIGTNNKLKQGCVAMKEWLHPIQSKDEQTGEITTTAKLTIDGDKDWNCAPHLVKALLNIQKDKHDQEIFANNPHNLTHSICSCIAFATEYNSEAIKPVQEQPPRGSYEMAGSESSDVSNRAKM